MRLISVGFPGEEAVGIVLPFPIGWRLLNTTFGRLLTPTTSSYFAYNSSIVDEIFAEKK